MEPEQARNRLLAVHRSVKRKNNHMLLGLLLFALLYRLSGWDWVMIAGVIYLGAIVLVIRHGSKTIADAYVQESEISRRELNQLVRESAGKPADRVKLACGYLEQEETISCCLLCGVPGRLCFLGDVLKRQSIYALSNQTTYLLLLEPKEREGQCLCWPLPLKATQWREKKERHLEYLMKWAQNQQDGKCLENFINDILLTDLLKKEANPIGFAGARGRLKRQPLYEYQGGDGITLVLTQEQLMRLGLKTEIA